MLRRPRQRTRLWRNFRHWRDYGLWRQGQLGARPRGLIGLKRVIRRCHIKAPEAIGDRAVHMTNWFDEDIFGLPTHRRIVCVIEERAAPILEDKAAAEQWCSETDSNNGAQAAHLTGADQGLIQVLGQEHG
jgi:hypothetical protein